MNQHVERARQIADALDSPDREATLHEQFYAEWKAWEAEDATRTMAAFDQEIGRGKDYTGRIVRFVTGAAQGRSPWDDGGNQARADRSAARQVLREQPEVLAKELIENPEVHARLLDAVEDEREKTETPPAARPNRDASESIERAAERIYWKTKGLISMMQDVEIKDPAHLRRVFADTHDALRFAEGLLESSNLVSEVEEWLSNAS